MKTIYIFLRRPWMNPNDTTEPPSVRTLLPEDAKYYPELKDFLTYLAACLKMVT